MELRLKRIPFAIKTALVCALLLITSYFAAPYVSALTYTRSESSCGQIRPQLRQGDRGTCVSLVQRKLIEKGYFPAGQRDTGYFGPITRNAVIALQQQHNFEQVGYVGPKTWRVLMDGPAPAAAAPARSSLRSTSLPQKCLGYAKVICVVKSSGSRAKLYAVERQNGQYVILQDLDARTGDARGIGSVTTEGAYSVGRRYEMWYSRSFNNAEMPYSLFFNGGQAIHYSADFARYGYDRGDGASHGCVNLRDRNAAAQLYNWAQLYTPVVVTR